MDSPPFPLMRLPPEIRQYVLRELLWQSVPIRKGSFEKLDQHECIQECSCRHFKSNPNFSFHPAVLRTCRQLRAEGQPILYDNVFGCDVWYNREEPNLFRTGGYISRLLSTDWDIMRIPIVDVLLGSWATRRKLIHMINKLDVIFHFNYQDELLEIRQGLRAFVWSVAELRQLSHLTFRIRSELVGSFEDDANPEPITLVRGAIRVSRQEFRDLGAGPLALMRGLQSVRFEGVSHGVASEPTMEMTRTSYIEDLPRMHGVLAQYVAEKLIDDEHCQICEQAHKYIDFARMAVELNDAAVFKLIRQRILHVIDKHQAFERKRIFRHDCSLDDSGNATSQSNKDRFGGSDIDDHLRTFAGGPEFIDDAWHEVLYEQFETESIRKAREEREKLKPALKTLWEICDDRFGNM